MANCPDPELYDVDYGRRLEFRQFHPWPEGLRFEDAETTDGRERFLMARPVPSLTRSGSTAGTCADAGEPGGEW